MLLAPFAWTLTIDPLTTAIGIVHLQVEHAFAPRFSLYGSPSLRLFDGILKDVNGPYKAYGVEVGARVFVWGEAPEGAWLMLRGVAAWMDPESGTGNPGGYTSVLGGYTGIFKSGLTLSGGLGVSYFDYGTQGHGTQGHGVYGLAPAAHTNLGWAW